MNVLVGITDHCSNDNLFVFLVVMSMMRWCQKSVSIAFCSILCGLALFLWFSVKVFQYLIRLFALFSIFDLFLVCFSYLFSSFCFVVHLRKISHSYFVRSRDIFMCFFFCFTLFFFWFVLYFVYFAISICMYLKFYLHIFRFPFCTTKIYKI